MVKRGGGVEVMWSRVVAVSGRRGDLFLVNMLQRFWIEPSSSAASAASVAVADFERGLTSGGEKPTWVE